MVSNIDAAEMNNLPFTFNFKSPSKAYQAEVLLKSVDKTDIRRFVITVPAYPKPTKATLEMISPINECLIQKFPIFNNSQTSWNYRITLEEKNCSNVFSIGQVILLTLFEI